MAFFAPDVRVVTAHPTGEEEFEFLFVSPAELQAAIASGEFNLSVHLGMIALGTLTGSASALNKCRRGCDVGCLAPPRIDAAVRVERFALMHRLVESPPLDLPLAAWERLYGTVYAFAPDCILELGRGWGNSTCVLNKAANELGARAVSIGFDSQHAWETRTAPRLVPHVGEAWFAPLPRFRPTLRRSSSGPSSVRAGASSSSGTRTGLTSRNCA